MSDPNRGGRPAHQPTDKDRKMVEAVSGFGIPQDKIASVLGVSVPTLLKHYDAELRRGAAMVEAQLVGNLLRLANGTDGTAFRAIEFALQSRFGWSKYAPPKAEPKPEPIGKKAAAEAEAQNAHTESEWGSLLN